ncbi:hypothetical protein D4R49_00170 [bacterium]|nr:MAG: hypothetical protein D4R49_00170 [bacterium]
MKSATIVLSVALPVVVWLLFGAPDLSLSGNLALFAIVILHLYAVIYVGSIFAWFGGDRFTYTMVAVSINGVSFLTTFVMGLITVWMFDRKVQSLELVSPLVWAVICIGFLVTIAIPMVTPRIQAPLPRASERRDFENPSDSN